MEKSNNPATSEVVSASLTGNTFGQYMAALEA